MADDASPPEGELVESSAAGASADKAAAESTEASESTEAAAVDDTEAAEPDEAVDYPVPTEKKAGRSHVRLAAVVGVVAVLALGGLVGWLGFSAYKAHNAEQQRELFLQVGRQGALNLTTIDWQHADQDVQRVLDSATGTFYDDFQKRAQPFIEVVKQAQSKSVGSIGEAGLESVNGDTAQVLVAVTVQTSNAGAPEQDPRAWRMRITVQKVDDGAKVADVKFVP